jgi:hypothetical protein
MKDEYDFTNAEQGKFYTPIEELELPIYLDKDNKDYLMNVLKKKKQSLNQMINTLIRQDIEISKRLA